ncbi:MAG: hypothetical protein M1490_04585 [Candidatus Bathyarchaeota archaeon]|nr:hypothetical protein [Candidatus Bathyarchaeota archaeon]
MALLSDPYALTATASLIIQVIVLFLLLYGYSLKRKLKFRQHGRTMAVALVLHLIMIFAIMIPSFAYAVVPSYIIPFPLELISIIGLLHGIAGIAVIILGGWLVAAWHFSKEFMGCFKRKSIMRVTITAWIAALILGIVLYILFYGAVLVS